MGKCKSAKRGKHTAALKVERATEDVAIIRLKPKEQFTLHRPHVWISVVVEQIKLVGDTVLLFDVADSAVPRLIVEVTQAQLWEFAPPALVAKIKAALGLEPPAEVAKQDKATKKVKKLAVAATLAA